MIRLGDDREASQALLIYAFVIVSNVVGVFVSSFVQRYTAPEIETILILGCFSGASSFHG